MRNSTGNIRSPRQLRPDEKEKRAAADATYVCRWIVQAASFKTHSIPQNIVDLAKRAIE